MPPITDAALRNLRQRYHCAYTAHQSCVLALNEATMSGKRPSPELLEKEAAALRERAEARAGQLAGWTELANDNGPHEPPCVRTVERA